MANEERTSPVRDYKGAYENLHQDITKLRKFVRENLGKHSGSGDQTRCDAVIVEIKWLVDQLTQAKAENARLQAMLPKTADGVTVRRGMSLFYPVPPRPDVVRPIEEFPYREQPCAYWPHIQFEDCYSTREAAQAAKEGQTK